MRTRRERRRRGTFAAPSKRRASRVEALHGLRRRRRQRDSAEKDSAGDRWSEVLEYLATSGLGPSGAPRYDPEVAARRCVDAGAPSRAAALIACAAGDGDAAVGWRAPRGRSRRRRKWRGARRGVRRAGERIDLNDGGAFSRNALSSLIDGVSDESEEDEAADAGDATRARDYVACRRRSQTRATSSSAGSRRERDRRGRRRGDGGPGAAFQRARGDGGVDRARDFLGVSRGARGARFVRERNALVRPPPRPSRARDGGGGVQGGERAPAGAGTRPSARPCSARRSR